jgi:hypothetical protein
LVKDTNQCVESIRILYNEGDIFFIELAISLKLTNNRYLRVERVNEKLNGDIRITEIGEYRIGSNNSNGTKSAYIHKKVIECYTGLNLNNLLDIITNYDKIYTFIETIDDSDNYSTLSYISFDSLIGVNSSIKIYDNESKNIKSIFLKTKIHDIPK